MKLHFFFISTLLIFGSCGMKKSVTTNLEESHHPIKMNTRHSIPVPITHTTLVQTPTYYPISTVFTKEQYYDMAYNELEDMLTGEKEPDFERAVFISENPYHNNIYSYRDFRQAINKHQAIIEKLIESNNESDQLDFEATVNQHGRFNLDDIRYLPKEKKELYQKALSNWAIFKYITDTTFVLTKSFPIHLPYTYANHDPFGLSDWSNSQVIHLLTSQQQQGNCFALTAFYKILADRLDTDARLCTAPQHIYIQHRDPKGEYYNVELATAGHPSDGTIKTLTHTTSDAIRNGIALRSYDEKQNIGICLINLAKSYERTYGLKDIEFIMRCTNLVLQHDSLNLNALLLKQQCLSEVIKNYATHYKTNDINTLKLVAKNETKHTDLTKTIRTLEIHLTLLHKLGYREMPIDMQKIIMTGQYPEHFNDKNSSPFTTIQPKEEHRQKVKALYGGLFQEVFEMNEFEHYGCFTFEVATSTITAIDTSFMTNSIIDPVAFAYDFGARMYDPRIGRFLSRDAHESKYPSINPYNFVANNPLLFIDPDGNDNVIYLIYHHDNEKPELKGVSASSIASEANKMYEKLGVKTRVVVFDESKMGKFNAKYMDKTDAFVVIGNFDEISNETGLKFGSTGLGMSKNGGRAAGVLTTNINKFKDLPTSSVSQLLAFGLVHETGHLASTDVNNESHSQFQDTPRRDANFMSDGSITSIIFSSPDLDNKTFYVGENNKQMDIGQVERLRESNKKIKGLMDLFDPAINSTNISNFEIRFKDNPSRDNYQKNETLMEEGVNMKGQISEPVIVKP